MTLAELAVELAALEYEEGKLFPVRYSHFNKKIGPPYITYKFAYSADLMADNKNYAKMSVVDIELYTLTKDPTKEAVLEAMFDNLQLTYSKIETYIDSEKLYQVVYETQIMGG
jgi:hypothetical protein